MTAEEAINWLEQEIIYGNGVNIECQNAEVLLDDNKSWMRMRQRKFCGFSVPSQHIRDCNSLIELVEKMKEARDRIQL